MGLNQNTWKLNQWYDQDVAGNVSYSGAGELFAWGNNQNGMLGQNSSSPSDVGMSSPIQIPGNWSRVAGGWKAVQATKTDGTLWGWGHNEYGNLGLNNTTEYSSPVQVGSDTTWPKTSYKMAKLQNDASNSGAAIKTDGTLWVWGMGYYGELGQNDNGSPANRSSPVQVGSESTWKSISACYQSFLATKTDGTLWSWGQAGNGQLGNNDKTMQSSPVQVPGTTWDITYASGWTSGLATRTDGTLWSWGENTKGELGLNSRDEYSSPIQIPGTTWARGGVGVTRTVNGAVKTDGTLWTWGSNSQGRLGLNDTVERSSPTQIPGTTWEHLSYSYNFMQASKTDGTLWSWGYNVQGQQGVNDVITRSSPVQIPGTWDFQTGAMHTAFGIKIA